MDKALLKAYIRTIVEEEVKRVVPEMLAEAVAEVKKLNKLNESAVPATPTKKAPALDRKRLAELMGMEYDRGAGELRATTAGLASRTITAKDSAGNPVELPSDAVPKEVVNAITKDYSALMKAMKLS